MPFIDLWTWIGDSVTKMLFYLTILSQARHRQFQIAVDMLQCVNTVQLVLLLTHLRFKIISFYILLYELIHFFLNQT